MKCIQIMKGSKECQLQIVYAYHLMQTQFSNVCVISVKFHNILKCISISQDVMFMVYEDAPYAKYV